MKLKICRRKVHKKDSAQHSTENHLTNIELVPYKIWKMFGFPVVMEEDEVIQRLRRQWIMNMV